MLFSSVAWLPEYNSCSIIASRKYMYGALVKKFKAALVNVICLHWGKFHFSMIIHVCERTSKIEALRDKTDT